jgi:cell division transport system ATP-binding protein
MIHLFRVHKTYPGNVPALVDINCSIARGEFVFITGPSGAGKTTLLKLLIASEQPDQGEILVNGRNIGRLKGSQVATLRREIGFVFQDFKLIPAKTIYENIALVPEAVGLSQRETARRVRQILRTVGLEDGIMKQTPQKISGGEQQRVAIARALVNAPAILLADEPTGNLDPVLTVEIMNLLQEVSRYGTTVVVATHDTTLIARYGRRVLTLNQGRLVS